MERRPGIGIFSGSWLCFQNITTNRIWPPGTTAGKFQIPNIMKAVYSTSVLLMSMFLATGVFAAKFTPPGIVPIHIVFSGKAYWDGATKSCLPRERGGCCHIWVDALAPGTGEIFGEMAPVSGNILQLTVSKSKGMGPDTYMKYFSDGKFTVDGSITFDPNVLSKLGVNVNLVVPAGSYPFILKGDLLIITFN